MSRRTAIGAGVGAAIAASLPARATAGHSLQRDVDAVHAADVVGVAAEVVTETGRRLRARSGVASIRHGGPVPWDGRFRIASTGKTFTATVVLQLAGEGRLSLDDTVDNWLPGVVDGNGYDGRKVTVRQLLQHTSGIETYTIDLLERLGTPEQWRRERWRIYRPGELIAMALRHKPRFAPGQGWYYANTNYVLAGMIIRKVTGRSWDREVHRRILAPLGLRDTSASGSSPYVPRPHARAYQRFEPGGPLVDVTVFNQTSGDAAGALTSSIGDLGRIFRALASGRLLRPAQLAEMRTTVPAEGGGWPPGARCGLGIYSQPLSTGGRFWSHGGTGHGYQVKVAVTPDGRRSVAIMGSSWSPKDLTWHQRFQKAVESLADNALR